MSLYLTINIVKRLQNPLSNVEVSKYKLNKYNIKRKTWHGCLGAKNVSLQLID